MLSLNFVVICVILNLSSAYYPDHINRHHHAYNCGFQKCIRNRSPPGCQKWCIIYVGPDNCQQPRYHCCQHREKPGICPAINSNGCLWAFPYYYTRIYECHHDFNCPASYKCCEDTCYVHKVCKIHQPVATMSPSRPETEETTVTGYRLDETSTIIAGEIDELTTPQSSTIDIFGSGYNDIPESEFRGEDGDYY